MGSVWEIEPESENPQFWICYHAAMLFFHGIFTYEQFDEIYKKITTQNTDQNESKH